MVLGMVKESWVNIKSLTLESVLHDGEGKQEAQSAVGLTQSLSVEDVSCSKLQLVSHV